VLSYWQDQYCSGSKLTALHFKNKESGGWPGDMKFFLDNGKTFYVPLADRAKAKAYFMPERCLYCVDKLNVWADISVGDNYTGRDESHLGSNSVIVRTEAGLTAWSAVRSRMQICQIDIADIQAAQAIDLRLENLYYGDLKEIGDLNPGIPRQHDADGYIHSRKVKLKKLSSGAVYDTMPQVLTNQIRRDTKKPNPIVRFFRRAWNYCKRKLL
jgi:hypothetical protein